MVYTTDDIQIVFNTKVVLQYTPEGRKYFSASCPFEASRYYEASPLDVYGW